MVAIVKDTQSSTQDRRNAKNRVGNFTKTLQQLLLCHVWVATCDK